MMVACVSLYFILSGPRKKPIIDLNPSQLNCLVYDGHMCGTVFILSGPRKEPMILKSPPQLNCKLYEGCMGFTAFYIERQHVYTSVFHIRLNTCHLLYVPHENSYRPVDLCLVSLIQARYTHVTAYNI